MSTANDHSIPIAPGDVLLGKYRVENVLGRGAMGLVVAARHLVLDDRVAIKVLLPQYVRDAEILQRFLREGRAAVRIRSPHVVRVADVGTLENGAPYMVMDYLEGTDLAAVLAERGSLPVPLAVELVLQVCEALAEAHAQGIVHRDVKPSNLFLTRSADGSPWIKVLDFGISKMSHAEDHALTRLGGVLGSPLYMSPEQLRSASDVDGRADIYSLGVVLFELLTGRTPFVAQELAQLVYLVTQGEPQRPRALRPDIPEALEQVILTAIARDRDRRFPTAADFALALVPFAPRHMRAAAERLFSALRGSLPVRPLAPGALPSASATGVAIPATTMPLGGGALTIAPVGTTNRKPTSRERRTLPIAIGLGVAVVSSGVFLWRLSDRAPHPGEGETAAAEGSQGALAEPSAAQPSAAQQAAGAPAASAAQPPAVEPSASASLQAAAASSASAAPQAAVAPAASATLQTATTPATSAAQPPAVEPSASASPSSGTAPGASAEASRPEARAAASGAPRRARPGGSAPPAKRSAPPEKRPTNTDPFRRDVF